MMFTRRSNLQESPDRLTSPAKRHHTFRNQIAKLKKSSKSLFKMTKEIGSYKPGHSTVAHIVTDTHLIAALPRRGQASLYKLGTGNAMSAGLETEIGRSLDIEDFECPIMALFVPLPDSHSELDLLSAADNAWMRGNPENDPKARAVELVEPDAPHSSS